MPKNSKHSPISRNRSAATIAGCLALGLLASVAGAQEWPAKPITAISPFGPGTSLEAAARPVFEEMAKMLGQPIVIEHRPGGGSTTGSAAVARATPDGYTLLLQSSTFTIVHSVYKNKRYDTLTDFIPIISFGVQPYVLVVAPSKGFKTVADLIKAAKASAGAMNYASLGVGSAPQIAAERFRMAAGIEAQNISFRGPPEALTETMTGRIDFYFIPLGSAVALVRDGKLTPLAVSTAARSDELPDVPTIAEAGLKDPGFELFVGLFAPANTPKPIVERLHAAATRAIATEAVTARLKAIAVKPNPMTQEQFESYFKKDVEATADVVAKAKISIE